MNCRFCGTQIDATEESSYFCGRNVSSQDKLIFNPETFEDFQTEYDIKSSDWSESFEVNYLDETPPIYISKHQTQTESLPQGGNSQVCSNCGHFIADAKHFCPKCGNTLWAVHTYNNAIDILPGRGLGVTAMVFGIISLIWGFSFTSIQTAMLGFILGLIASGVAKAKGRSNGFATAGIACSLVVIIAWILVPLILIFAYFCFIMMLMGGI